MPDVHVTVVTDVPVKGAAAETTQRLPLERRAERLDGRRPSSTADVFNDARSDPLFGSLEDMERRHVASVPVLPAR